MRNYRLLLLAPWETRAELRAARRAPASIARAPRPAGKGWVCVCTYVCIYIYRERDI